MNYIININYSLIFFKINKPSIEDIVMFITMKMMSESVGITVRSVPSLEEL